MYVCHFYSPGIRPKFSSRSAALTRVNTQQRRFNRKYLLRSVRCKVFHQEAAQRNWEETALTNVLALTPVQLDGDRRI